jgi:hypothetical protein
LRKQRTLRRKADTRDGDRSERNEPAGSSRRQSNVISNWNGAVNADGLSSTATFKTLTTAIAYQFNPQKQKGSITRQSSVKIWIVVELHNLDR